MALWRNALRLAGRDLRGGPRGFGVFLGCLFLGVFAVAAINAFSEASRAGLAADARALLGGDVEVRLVQRPFTADERDWLTARGPASEIVELRTMARAGTDRQLLVELKAVDAAYPLAGQLEREPALTLATLLGADAAGRFGALADPALLDRLGLKVGDSLQIGGISLRISARLLREPDRSLRAFTLGPRLLVSRAALAASGLLQPGALTSTRLRLNLPAGLDAESWTAALKARFPEAGWRVQTARNAAPRVRFFIDRMAGNLTLVGLCALLTGGLGVATAVRGYLAGKRLEIATLKCLGATPRLVFCAYLLQLLALAAVGIAAGLLAGGAVPWLVQTFFARLLPIPLAPGLFPGPLAVAASFGLLVVLAFSLAELGRARHVPGALLFRGQNLPLPQVLDRSIVVAILAVAVLLVGLTLWSAEDRRIAGWFVGAVLLCMGVFRLLARGLLALLRRLPRPRSAALRLALTNLQRPGSAAPAALFSLGLGLTALVVIAQVEHSLSRQVRDTLPEQAPTLYVIGLQPAQAPAFEALVHEQAPAGRLQQMPTLRGRIVQINDRPVDQVTVDPEVAWAVRGDRFLTWAATLLDSDEVVAGERWPADYSGPPLLSLTEDVARGFGVGVGDSLTVNVLGRDIRARIASLRRVDWSTLALNFVIVFAPGVLEDAPQSLLAAAYVPPKAEAVIARRLARDFPGASLVSVREVLANVQRVIDRLGLAFRAIAAVALISGFLVLAGTVAAEQHRRLYEATVLKVCGATRRDILTAFVGELALLGLTAGLVSVSLGSLAAGLMVHYLLEMDFVWSPLVAGGTVALGLILTIGLGLTGTRRALARCPLGDLRND